MAEKTKEKYKIILTRPENMSEYVKYELECPSSMKGKELIEIAEKAMIAYSNMDYGTYITMVQNERGGRFGKNEERTLEELGLNNASLTIDWDTSCTCIFCTCCMCCSCCLLLECCKPAYFNSGMVPKEVVNVESTPTCRRLLNACCT